MATNSNETGNRRLKMFGGIAALLIVLAAFGAYWFLFRDTSADSVNTAEAAEARQAAIDEAAARADAEADTDQSAEDDAGTDPADAQEDSTTAVDVGQPDSAASVGSPTDGVWTVDTSIGTFGDECLTGACGSTFAGFRINEELAGVGAKTVVGRTPGVSGSMELSGNQVIGAMFEVDMTQLITDSGPRTNALRGERGGLETDTFPTAVFELTEPITFDQEPVEGQSVQVEAVGNLTVHGVTNPVTIPLTAELQAGLISVFGELQDIQLADYEIPTPTAAVVLSIEDTAIMELQLFLTR